MKKTTMNLMLLDHTDLCGQPDSFSALHSVPTVVKVKIECFFSSLCRYSFLKLISRYLTSNEWCLHGTFSKVEASVHYNSRMRVNIFDQQFVNETARALILILIFQLKLNLFVHLTIDIENLFLSVLTLPAPCISESYSKMKINLNLFFFNY